MTASNWLARRLASIRTAKQRSGDAAEERALHYLQQQGLLLVQRSFLCKGGELDLIMRDGQSLVFVEVRQRADARFGGAIAGIGRTKIYQAINDGHLKARKYGKRTLILRSELHEFLANLPSAA